MLKKLLVSSILIFTATGANAACYGSGNFKTCYDNNGNNYTINQFGNTTYTNGYNTQTGNSWSQTDQTIGDSVYTNGRASNGNSWNKQQHQLGGGNSTISGTDSNGNSFYKYCTKVTGCN